MSNIKLISLSFLASVYSGILPNNRHCHKICSYFSVDCFVCPIVVNLLVKRTAVQDIVHSFLLWLDEVGPGSSCVNTSELTRMKNSDVNAPGVLG